MIDLKNAVAETIIINPPHLQQRRTSSEALCKAIGLTQVRFSEGTEGLPHQLACALAHRKAMNAVSAWPSLVLEDDLELASGAAVLPPLPENADIVYLSVSPFGCLPWSYDNLALARHRAIQGLSLASVHDADWLKLHSMSGAVAILYVTEKGLDTWKQATLQSRRFGGAFDVFTAYAMKDVNVYAPHRPVFCEDAALQRDDLRRNAALFEQRLNFTRTPLRTFEAGDQTVVTYKGQVITVEAVALTEDTLQWQVVSVEKSDRPKSPFPS
ncbi:hypothetical protein ACG74X_19790 [Marivita sp. S0852]|uniref:hypothetical protein n=1 Tax=Marivita sp. S0852 TaxID=3373893 RepID=UPI0039820FAD